MKKTKELGKGLSVTVKFGKNVSKELMDEFIEHTAKGSWGTNNIPSGSDADELVKKSVERITTNLKVGVFESAVIKHLEK